MTTFKWEGKYIVWAEMSESYIAHIEAENAKEAEEKARQLPLESWELVDGHGDIKIDEVVPLEQDEIWHSRQGNTDLQDSWENAVAKPLPEGTATKQTKIKMRILWGIEEDPDNEETYYFDTKAEARAFTRGIEHANGWERYEILEYKENK